MPSFRKNENLSPTLIGHHIKKRFFEKFIDFYDFRTRLSTFRPSTFKNVIDFRLSRARAREKKHEKTRSLCGSGLSFLPSLDVRRHFLHIWQRLGRFPASQGRKQMDVTGSHILGALRLLWRLFLPMVICLYLPSAKRRVERLNGKIRDVIIFRHKKAAHIGRPGVLMYIVRISGALFFNVVV